MKSLKIPKMLGFIAALFFLFISSANCQQKIQIKENTAIVGHFFVEILHNMPGAPMKHFQGDGGNIEVREDVNNFILRMQNFIWYDPDTRGELIFDTDKININSVPTFTIKQESKKITLKPISSYIRDISFELVGKGKVKMSIPFEFNGKQSRFLQEFTLKEISAVADNDKVSSKTDKSKVKSPSLKEIKSDWNSLDKDDKTDVEEFISRYSEIRKALKYLKKANKLLDEIIAKEKTLQKLEANRKNIAQSSPVVKTKPKSNANSDVSLDVKSNSEEEENKDLSTIDDLQDEIQETVDNLKNDEIETAKDQVFRDLVLNYGNNTKSVKIGITEMPVQLNFLTHGEEESSLLNTVSINKFYGDTIIAIDKSLLNKGNVSGEFSSFALKNAFGTEIFREDFALDNTVSESYIVPTILSIGLLLLLGALFMFFNKKRKKKRQQEYKKKVEENRKNNIIGQQAISDEPVKVAGSAAKSKAKIKIGQKSSPSETKTMVPPASIARKASNSRIKISPKKKTNKELSFDDFMNETKLSKAIHLNLETLWQDSSISNVYLSSVFIQELDNFLAESSNEGIQNELQGAVPEVGGFMMGRFSSVENKLHVLFEKFVPFVPEYNDVFKIEIGTKTIVEELGDAQDKNPNMKVVGWFHTHPGHGLFLSTSDLSVQRHFAKDYQVAMEIDSLTKGLDMSIFTRKTTGRMNNSNDRLSDAWFQWVDIDNMNTK